MSEECARVVPALTGVLSGLKETTRLVAFVADLFGADSFDAAAAAGVARRYLFFPTNLHVLTLILHLPELDVSMPGEFRDLAEPVRLPGCVPIPGPDILSPLQDKSNPCYRWMVHHARRYRDAEAILVNSFDAVEPDVARVLRAPQPGRPPVYNIGPLIKTDAVETDNEPRAPCLEWLDRQPPRSVIFVSFGSGGSLPAEQMRELALGLEQSGQRFLWVVRSPSDEGAVNANYYDAESKRDPLPYLPEGFVERTKGVGLLVPSWAPQIKVLAHEATGGFLVHCGWNSVLESLRELSLEGFGRPVLVLRRDHIQEEVLGRNGQPQEAAKETAKRRRECFFYGPFYIDIVEYEHVAECEDGSIANNRNNENYI
ncbi:UDP-glycosyltransferase 72B1 [Triticum urartu]|uniref:UDP-glycosyltransferase 72B1 n=1 Tax=Triticum urartu TaxID=4572 RepID=M7YQB3_TRIUA|nr:UDP-glycosyltransferase 72B1 [Triticum urartu]